LADEGRYPGSLSLANAYVLLLALRLREEGKGKNYLQRLTKPGGG
jgi:hypothetical protein